jgi:hypothetical protein
VWLQRVRPGGAVGVAGDGASRPRTRQFDTGSLSASGSVSRCQPNAAFVDPFGRGHLGGALHDEPDHIEQPLFVGRNELHS